MKTIKLKNESIHRVLNLLEKVSMKNKASRGKIKFMKKLQEKDEELLEGRMDLQKEYFLQDEHGDFIVGEDNSLVYKDEGSQNKKDEFVSRLVELMHEKFEISFSEYAEKFEAMFEVLDNLDMELLEDALAYDELMDAYENND